MKAARMMRGTVSLNRALLLCGVYKKAWYYDCKQCGQVFSDAFITAATPKIPRSMPITTSESLPTARHP